MTRKSYPIFLLWLVLALALPRLALAGGVVLTITNMVNGSEMAFTEDALLAMPQTVVETENEFVDAKTLFSGPLARNVLKMLGEGGDTVVLTAVNDYAVEVPLEDFIKYDVVFAMSGNGERFSRRDKGPVWVIYPMSDFEELQDPVYNARLIWQLVKVEVK
ncbi:MAG: hypothetical protein L3J37_01990 [Rhodobacteraceae bacterium]|nr:hypothetical protein [Paracoccaceae bacterium]